MKGVIYVRDPNTKKLVRVPQLGVVNYDDTKIKQLITALQNNKVDKVPGKQLSDQNYSKEEKDKLAGVQAGAVAYPKGGYNRLRNELAGAKFNEQSGYYELNGLKDLTVEEMDEIYLCSERYQFYPNRNNSWAFAYIGIRTNLIVGRDRWFAKDQNMNLNNLFYACGKMKVAKISGEKEGDTNTGVYVNYLNASFAECVSLHTIIGNIIFAEKAYAFNAFLHCFRLVNIKISKLSLNISFENSKSLSKDSILYMVKNSEATSGITITLHPDAYAMAMADTDIQSALKGKTFVSLAEAVQTA